MSMDLFPYVKANQVFTGCTTAAGLCTGLSTAYTGLLIYNPYGSGVSLIMYDGAATLSVVPGAVAQPMISVSGAVSQTAVTAGTAAGVIMAAKIGTTGTNAGSLALLRTITTLPAVNVNFKAVPGSIQTGAVTVPQFYIKFDGTLIVQPGTGVMWSFTTTAYTAQYSFTWAEVSVF